MFKKKLKKILFLKYFSEENVSRGACPGKFKKNIYKKMYTNFCFETRMLIGP